MVLAAPCDAAFRQLTRSFTELDCRTAPAVVGFRNPFGLQDWTMPVVETLMVVGAVLALRHAWCWWRRRGDPTNLALWGATIVYVLVLEPPLYFPRTFGLQSRLGLVFAHNVFSVDLLYDRLPLYIVALYPAGIYLAYALVQRAGIFDRHLAVVGAACVGFVHMSFYEIFDNIGPQLRWWVWNPAAKSNEPMFGSVPLTSLVLFATFAPFAAALLVRLLVARRVERGPAAARAVVPRAVLAGLLTPLLMAVGGAPTAVFGGAHPDHTGQAVLLWAEVAIFAAVAVYAFRRAAAVGPRPAVDGGYLDRYVLIHSGLFLVTFAVLWVAALPAYLSARHGVTAGGTPTGELAYVLGCLACAAAAVGIAYRGGRSGEVRPPATPAPAVGASPAG